MRFEVHDMSSARHQSNCPGNVSRINVPLNAFVNSLQALRRDAGIFRFAGWEGTGRQRRNYKGESEQASDAERKNRFHWTTSSRKIGSRVIRHYKQAAASAPFGMAALSLPENGKNKTGRTIKSGPFTCLDFD
jgi:hypothetical protein